VAGIKELETQRSQHVAEGRPFYEVVACIDGRGFRERREDMRQMLLRLNGKVFTMATLDQLIIHTCVREFFSAALERAQMISEGRFGDRGRLSPSLFLP
jgi:hypothetical protein